MTSHVNKTASSPRPCPRLDHDWELETQFQARLLAAIPPPHVYHVIPRDGKALFVQEFFSKVKDNLFGTKEHLSRDDFEQIRQTLDSQFEEGNHASAFEQLALEKKAEIERDNQAHEEAKQNFFTLLQRLVAERPQCSKDATATTTDVEVVPYPDHNFAIQESELFFDFALAPFFHLEAIPPGVSDDDDIDNNSHCLMIWDKPLIQRSNIPKGMELPSFCDYYWNNPEESYYKVDYLEGNRSNNSDDNMEEPTLLLDRQTVTTFFGKIQQELENNVVQWSPYAVGSDNLMVDEKTVGHKKMPITITTTIVRPCLQRGMAHVLAFRSEQGDRIEYWRDDEEVGSGDAVGSFVLVQTASGRLLMVGTTDGSGHPFVICNLLQFINSDGSEIFLSLFPNTYTAWDDAQATATMLVHGACRIAESFLYDQEH